MRIHRLALATLLGLSPAIVLTGCPDEGTAPASTDTPASTSGSGEPATTTTGVTSEEAPTGTSEVAPTGTSGEATTGSTGDDSTQTSGVVIDPPPVHPPIDCGPDAHFAADKQPTRIVHVSPAGSDSPACGAADDPCASIGAAVASLTPGTAVRLHEGTYTTPEVLVDLQGTSDAPIWLGGAPGEAIPVIRGPGSLSLSRVRYLVLHDLAFEESPQLKIDDGGARDDPEASRFVALERLTLRDVGGFYESCARLAGVNDLWVVDSEFSECGGSIGDGLHLVGNHRGHILRNTFHEVSYGFWANAGSEDIEFRGNLVVANNTGAVFGDGNGDDAVSQFRPPLNSAVANAEARDLRAIANLFVGGLPVDFAGCVDCLAANNTIIDPWSMFGINNGTYPQAGYWFAAAANGRFVNNLVVFRRAKVAHDVWMFWDADLYTLPKTFVARSNLWYAVDAPHDSSPHFADYGVQEFDSIAGLDPRLVDLEGGDYHPTFQSPARASGAPLAELSGDLDGLCYGDPPNIGAFATP